MSLNSSNKATITIDRRIRDAITEDTGLHVPSSIGEIYCNTNVILLAPRTGAYIKLANLDPDIHVMTKSISMIETYFTTVRSSAGIPKFLLWLQEQVRDLSSRRIVAYEF